MSASTERSSGRDVSVAANTSAHPSARNVTSRSSPVGSVTATVPSSGRNMSSAIAADPTDTNSSGTSTDRRRTESSSSTGIPARFCRAISRRRSSTAAACAIPADTAASRNATTSVTSAPVTRSSSRIAPCGSCEASTAGQGGDHGQRTRDEPGQPEPADHAPRGPRVVEQPARREQAGGRRRAAQLDLADEPEHPRPDRVERREADRQGPDERGDRGRTECTTDRADDHEEPDPGERDEQPDEPERLRRRASGHAERRDRDPPQRERPGQPGQQRHGDEGGQQPLPPDPQLADRERGPLERQHRGERQQQPVERDAEHGPDQPLPGGLDEGQADHLARRHAQQPQRGQARVAAGDAEPGGTPAEGDQRDDEEHDRDPGEDLVHGPDVRLTGRQRVRRHA